ncbi:TetR/AcrR family transcriptional regulator [Rhodococcus sp. IC4_135]|uniref:TetR family transcriptional regulator n=1 Tax=Rhodococcus sp. IC4_135 TaxID=2715537 RepID=UPI00141D79C2|nr:TetR/AcrR family transcriptional regulator [Rhodococcus sp. IC4_135]
MARRIGSPPLPSPIVSRRQSTSSVQTPSTARGRRTRSALIHAARETFEQMGFRDARISDIAAQAGTSYGVFYHYFKTKEEILGEIFTVITGEMFTASRPSVDVASDPYSRILEANRTYLAVARRNARLIAVIEEMAIREPYFRDLKLQIREPFLRRNAAGIRSLQSRGIADPDLDADLTASILGGMVENFTLLWFVHGVEYDEESAVTTLTKLWARAIGVSPSTDASTSASQT